MPNTIVVGMQWGDEGKGKDIDLLSENHKVIVRYQGGANAGHTVVIGDEKYALHLLPSGILRAGKTNILGNNVVVDPAKILEEIRGLRERGIEVTPDNLKISHKAHIVTEYNKILDGVKGGRIGTTGRGIGPTYADKADRIGIRMCDLYDTITLEEKIKQNLEFKNHVLQFFQHPPVSPDKILVALLEAREELLPFLCNDIAKIIHENNGSVLAEGAQATLLDIDHGTYPFVTSSNPTIGGFYTGTGAGYIKFDTIVGILKAYTTRVGEGPFPTEQDNETGERLRKIGAEFGTTTGRPRRCGWQDLRIAHYAIATNGITEISSTKLDVLSQEKVIRVCKGYEIDGERVDHFPVEQLGRCTPIYEELPGWQTDISNARKADDLPKNARAYIDYLQFCLRVPIKRVGVGPRRDQVVEFN